MYHIIKNECPHCYQGKVFKDKNLFTLRFPQMNDKCSHCGFIYEKEPGHFWGAMYISYALVSLESVLTYLISTYLLGVSSVPYILISISIVIILFTFFNFKLSRLVWLYLFKDF